MLITSLLPMDYNRSGEKNSIDSLSAWKKEKRPAELPAPFDKTPRLNPTGVV
jgi:hypothetical protein